MQRSQFPGRRTNQTLAGLVAGFGLMVASQTWAGVFGLRDTGWDGLSAAVSEIETTVGGRAVRTPQELDWGDLHADDALLVIYPTAPLEQESFSSFLNAGGRVAILDDFGASPANLKPFKIVRDRAPDTPLRSLRSNPRLALAEPVEEMVAGRPTGRHPIVASVDVVATNHPQGLQHPGLTPILRIPARDESSATLAVAGVVGQGRLVVIADSSVLINQMMRYPGNRMLAKGLALYLMEHASESGNGGRLFIMTGAFEQTGSFGGVGPWGLVSGWAGELRGWLRSTQRHGLSPTAMWALGIALVFGLALWMMAKSARLYAPWTPRFARRVPLVAQGGLAGRIAILAAPTSHRALALLELKSAFEETVAQHIGASTRLSGGELLDALAHSGRVPTEALASLKKLLLTMSVVETSVVARQPIRVRERDLQTAAKQLTQILESLERSSSP